MSSQVTHNPLSIFFTILFLEIKFDGFVGELTLAGEHRHLLGGMRHDIEIPIEHFVTCQNISSKRLNLSRVQVSPPPE